MVIESSHASVDAVDKHADLFVVACGRASKNAVIVPVDAAANV
jgi:hypothetical protein